VSGRIKRIFNYALYILFADALYGVVLYLVYSWLSGYSLIFAYLANLVLIIFALASDSITFKIYDTAMLSKDNAKEFRKSRFMRFQMEAFVSYKTALYLFYILILFFSQIINSYPTLINENLKNFVSANEYSILILIAVDLLARQFLKDRETSKEFKEKVEKYLAENPEE